jgi:hypothetical protein
VNRQIYMYAISRSGTLWHRKEGTCTGPLSKL